MVLQIDFDNTFITGKIINFLSIEAVIEVNLSVIYQFRLTASRANHIS